MLIKSKATGVEMDISDETWAQFQAQGLQSKFTIVKKASVPAEATKDDSSTDVDTSPKPVSDSNTSN